MILIEGRGLMNIFWINKWVWKIDNRGDVIIDEVNIYVFGSL